MQPIILLCQEPDRAVRADTRSHPAQKFPIRQRHIFLTAFQLPLPDRSSPPLLGEKQEIVAERNLVGAIQRFQLGEIVFDRRTIAERLNQAAVQPAILDFKPSGIRLLRRRFLFLCGSGSSQIRRLPLIDNLRMILALFQRYHAKNTQGNPFRDSVPRKLVWQLIQIRIECAQHGKLLHNGKIRGRVQRQIEVRQLFERSVSSVHSFQRPFRNASRRSSHCHTVDEAPNRSPNRPI